MWKRNKLCYFQPVCWFFCVSFYLWNFTKKVLGKTLPITTTCIFVSIIFLIILTFHYQHILILCPSVTCLMEYLIMDWLIWAWINNIYIINLKPVFLWTVLYFWCNVYFSPFYLIRYAHNTLMSVHTTGQHGRYHQKIPLFRFRKRKWTAVSVTVNVGACLALAHALWLMTEWPEWWILFDRDNAMLGGITFWEFDLLTTDLHNNY